MRGFDWRADYLKRDIVVVGAGRRHVVAEILRLIHCATAAHASGATGRTLAAAAQELHALRDDLGARALTGPVLGFPLPRGQAPFDIDLSPLLQILAAQLGLFAVYDDVMPLGGILVGAVASLEALAGCHRKIGDRLARGQVAHFGIASEIAEQNHFIY